MSVFFEGNTGQRAVEKKMFSSLYGKIVKPCDSCIYNDTDSIKEEKGVENK